MKKIYQKRLVYSLLAALMCVVACILCVPAFAEEEEVIIPEPVIVQEEPAPAGYSWEYLATIAGATAATLLIVQFLKLPLDKIWKIPTRLVVYVISLIIILLAQYFTIGLTIQSGILSIINAFVVALAAMGAYELTFAKADRAKALKE